MKSGLYYCNIIKEAQIPKELIEYVPEQVYEDEELERHASIARMMLDIKYHSSSINEKFLFERIKLLIKIAYENYNTYKNLYNRNGFHPSKFKSLSDINLIPYITKEELMQVYQEAIDNPLINIHHESSTTGTQGNALKLINDIDSHHRSFIHIFQMYEDMVGEKITPTDWIYSIYDENQLLTSILGEYRICTISIDAPLEAVACHIRKLRPKIVSGYASKIIELTSYLPDAKEIGIKLFTTNSEYSSAYERNMISKRLGVPVLDEYSSEELLIMGWEKSCGKYYVPQDFSYIEFVKGMKSELLSVVGTNIWDLTMPRIRYIQGDYVEKAYYKDGKLYFENITGKESYLVVKGKIISPLEIMRIFDKILLSKEWVVDYQIIQNIDDKITFYYCTDDKVLIEVEYDMIRDLKVEFDKVFLGENIDFIKTKKIERKSSKKTYIVKKEVG